MMATAEIYIGEIASSRRRLDRLAARNMQLNDPVRFARFQAERGVSVSCTLSLALWYTGEVNRAMQVARAAVERAERSGHVVSHSNALAVFAVPISFWSGDYDATEGFLSAIEVNGQREDIGVWRESCRFFKAAVKAKRRLPGAAFELKARLKELIAARSILRAPMHYSMVAEALLDADAISDARELIDQAQALAIEQDAHWCLPEIVRISALVELHSGYPGNAELLLRKSVTKASAIGALTLELRAVLSLASILDSEGQRRQGFVLQDAICTKFPKNEKFADLRDARELLRRLQKSGGTLTSWRSECSLR